MADPLASLPPGFTLDAPAAPAAQVPAAGLLRPGNIDLNNRPTVKMPDGSIATVRSTSVNFDGQEFLIPTVADDGALLDDEAAIDLFRKSGKHLGVFDTPANATAFAKQLSAQQGKQYAQAPDPLASLPPGFTVDAPAAPPADAPGGVTLNPSYGLSEAWRTIGGGLRDMVQNTSDFFMDIPQLPHVQALMAAPTLAPQVLSGNMAPEDAGQAVREHATGLEDLQKRAQLPDIPDPESFGNKLLRPMVTLGAGMVAPSRMMQGTTALGPSARGMISGAIADLTATDPDDPNLSNMIQGTSPKEGAPPGKPTMFANPVNEALAKRPNEPFMNRFRDMLEGAIIGGTAETALRYGGDLIARLYGRTVRPQDVRPADVTPDVAERALADPEVRSLLEANGLVDPSDPAYAEAAAKAAARLQARRAPLSEEALRERAETNVETDAIKVDTRPTPEDAVEAEAARIARERAAPPETIAVGPDVGRQTTARTEPLDPGAEAGIAAQRAQDDSVRDAFDLADIQRRRGAEYQERRATAEDRFARSSALSEDELAATARETGIDPTEIRGLTPDAQRRLHAHAMRQRTSQEAADAAGPLRTSDDTGDVDGLQTSPASRPNVPADRSQSRGEFEDPTRPRQMTDAEIEARGSPDDATIRRSQEQQARSDTFGREIEAERARIADLDADGRFRELEREASVRNLTNEEMTELRNFRNERQAAARRLRSAEGKAAEASRKAGLGSRTASGTSDRPFRDTEGLDPDQARFFEERARAQAAEAQARMDADLEAEWAARQQARARYTEGQRDAGQRAHDSARDHYEGASKFTNKPGPQDGAGRFGTDRFGFVTDKDGLPVRFGDQRQAARWIINEGQKKSPDQHFEIENHPSGKGFSVRERGRRANDEPPPGGGEAPRTDAPESAAPQGEPRRLTGPRQEPTAEARAPEPEAPRPRTADDVARELSEARARLAKAEQRADTIGRYKNKTNPKEQARSEARIAKAREEADAEAARVAELRNELNRMAGRAEENPAAVAPRRTQWDRDVMTGKNRPTPMLQRIRQLGGIRDTGGELRAMDANKFPGLMRNASRMDPDYMREALVEEGYLPEDATVADLFDAIGRDMASSKDWRGQTYRDSDLEEVLARQDAEDDLLSMSNLADEMGVPYNRDFTPDQIRQAIEDSKVFREAKNRTTRILDDTEGRESGAAESDQGRAGGARSTDREPAGGGREDGVDNRAPVRDEADDWWREDAEGVGPERFDDLDAAEQLRSTFYSNPVFDPAMWRMMGRALQEVGGWTKAMVDRWEADLRANISHLKSSTALSGVRAVHDAIRALYRSSDGYLRSFANRYQVDGKPNPTITKIADMFFAPVGKADDAVGRTYGAAVDMQSKRMANRLAKALEPFSPSTAARLKHPNKTRDAQEAALKQLGRKIRAGNVTRGKSPMDDAAAEIRDMLREHLKYLREAGVEVGDVGLRYLPRELDRPHILANEGKFLSKATDLYRSEGLDPLEAREAAEAWLSRIRQEEFGFNSIDGDEFTQWGGASPGTKYTKSRTFGPAADRILADFYLQNPADILPAYFMRTTRQAEWVRRMGNGQWKEMKAQLHKDGADAAIPEIVRTLELATGQVPTPRSAGARVGLGIARAVTTLTFLPQATLSALTEPIVTSMRSGHMVDALNAYRYSIRDALANVKGLPGRERALQARALAEDLGLISSAGDDMIMEARFGGSMEGVAGRKIQANFFRRTLLHGMTEKTRVGSMRIGQIFMRRLAKDIAAGGATQRSSRRLMRELGIPDEKLNDFSAWMLKHDDGFPTMDVLSVDKGDAALYRTALNRFVDQSIMSPKGIEKPRYASTPLGGVVYALQSFLYGFSKNVVLRTLNTTKATFNPYEDLGGLDRMRMAMPLVMGGVLVAATYANRDLRDWYKDDPARTPQQKDKTFDEKALRALSASGITGAFDLPVNIFTSVRYEKDPVTALLGPLIGKVSETIGSAVALTGRRNSENTNTAERTAARNIYDLMVAPSVSAGMSLLPGPAGAVAGGIGIQAVTHPAVREKFVGGIAGPNANLEPRKLRQAARKARREERRRRD